MKIAVLSDIHGNHIALQKVLTEINQTDIKKIFIAGDFIGYYFWPREVLSMIQGLDVFAIKGNHEEMFFSIINQKACLADISKKYGSGMEEALNNLDKNQIRWLKDLPVSNNCVIDGKKISIFHGSPWDPNFYVYPNSNESIIMRCFQEEADLIILGHTHIQMELIRKNKKILNPGSVGQPRDGRVGAQWATVDLDTLKVKFMCTEYDNSLIKHEVYSRHKDMKILTKSLYEK